MQLHRAKAVVSENGTLKLEKLPFPAGESVEVLVFPAGHMPENGNRYPLRGTPIKYENPTAPVLETEWEALNRP